MLWRCCGQRFCPLPRNNWIFHLSNIKNHPLQKHNSSQSCNFPGQRQFREIIILRSFGSEILKLRCMNCWFWVWVHHESQILDPPLKGFPPHCIRSDRHNDLIKVSLIATYEGTYSTGFPALILHSPLIESKLLVLYLSSEDILCDLS